MAETNYVLRAYEKMNRNPSLAGSFSGEAFTESDVHIVWQLSDGYRVEIASETILIYKKCFGKVYESIHHWHPCDEDLYDEICMLGTKGNVTVIHRSCFGDSRILYSGPREACHIKRKNLFGKNIFLYAD